MPRTKPRSRSIIGCATPSQAASRQLCLLHGGGTRRSIYGFRGKEGRRSLSSVSPVSDSALRATFTPSRLAARGPLGGQNAEHDPHRHLDLDPGGRFPNLALQPGMGIWPIGRRRLDSRGPAHPCAAWKDLTPSAGACCESSPHFSHLTRPRRRWRVARARAPGARKTRLGSQSLSPYPADRAW